MLCVCFAPDPVYSSTIGYQQSRCDVIQYRTYRSYRSGGAIKKQERNDLSHPGAITRMITISTRFSLSMVMSRLMRDGTVETVSQTKFAGTNEDIEILIFPIQLNTSRIGNLTRLVLTLAICVTIPGVCHGRWLFTFGTSLNTCGAFLHNWSIQTI